MNAVNELIRSDDRPPYIRFEQRPMEDRAASLEKGHYVTRAVDFVVITPVGSKDEIPKIAREWLEQCKQQAKEGRLPQPWLVKYEQAYEAWKRNEELPEDGTPIKGWQVLSPAQQQQILAANIRTVEDLARINGEAKQRIGMGAEELRVLAEKWLRTAKDVGSVVQENTALRVENAALKARLAEVEQKLAKAAAEAAEKKAA